MSCVEYDRLGIGNKVTELLPQELFTVSLWFSKPFSLHNASALHINCLLFAAVYKNFRFAGFLCHLISFPFAHYSNSVSSLFFCMFDLVDKSILLYIKCCWHRGYRITSFCRDFTINNMVLCNCKLVNRWKYCRRKTQKWKMNGKSMANGKSFPHQMLFIKFFQYSIAMETVYRNVFTSAHDMYG